MAALMEGRHSEVDIGTDCCVFPAMGPTEDPSHAARAALGSDLRAVGVKRAWVSPVEGLWSDQDLPSVNERLRRWGSIPGVQTVPVPVVGLSAQLGVSLGEAWWRDVGTGRVAAVRVVPGAARHVVPRLETLAGECAEHGLRLVVQVRVSDPRCLPADIAPVDLDPGALSDVVPRLKGSVLLAGLRESEAREVLRLGMPAIDIETSHLDTPDALRHLLTEWGPDHIRFGSHAPLFPPLVAARRVAAVRHRCQRDPGRELSP